MSVGPLRVTGDGALRRFALVSTNYHPRTCGVGDNSAWLAAELVRRGNSVTILTRAPAERNPMAPGIPVIGFEERGPLSVARAVLRWLERNPAHEVVVQYTPQMFDAVRFGSPAIPWLIRALCKRGMAVTLMAHELYVPWSLRPDLLAAAVMQRVQLAACARRTTKLAVTTGTRMALLEDWLRFLPGSAPLRLVRVGANVEPRAWAPMREGFRMGTFSTLSVGRRLDIVLDAFGRIVREVPEAELWLLGDLLARDNRMTRRFVDAVSAHPAADRIRLPGKQSLTDIAAAIASLHVYLFVMDTGANTRSGTLPVALGSGVPVVATRGAETDAVFENERNVLFAPSLSGEAFAEAVMRVRNDSELAAVLSRGARALYAEHLAWPRIADAVIA